MKLQTIYAYEGTITLLTGLAIRGAGSELSIGGADSEVIKNPITGEPYIPGSSLKGKMRSQLERVYGAKKYDNKVLVEETVAPCGCGECDICRVFGAHKNTKSLVAPTRIIVRDAVLTEECRAQIANMPVEAGNSLELKAENMIKRNSGTADAPRFMERVPAGMEFHVELMLQVFDKDDAERMKKLVEEGLKLVEMSYLGGSGSRGYGQVKFNGEWKKVVVGE